MAFHLPPCPPSGEDRATVARRSWQWWGMGTGGRWVGTRPFQGSCQRRGLALLGLFRSCGHTQRGAGDAPFLCFLLLHLLCHLFLRRLPALRLFFLPAPLGSASPVPRGLFLLLLPFPGLWGNSSGLPGRPDPHSPFSPLPFPA